MGSAMDEAKKIRAKYKKKWDEYAEKELPLTPERLKEMKHDNEVVAEYCKKATEEWLKEEGE